MESYCKVAIMITAKELTAISAAVQGKVCKAVCDASEDAAEELDSVFFGALDEALGRIGIVLEFRTPVGSRKAHTIVIGNRESRELAAVQAETWRKGIAADCPVSAVANAMVGATLAFLGIKVKAVRRPPKNARGYGAWRDCSRQGKPADGEQPGVMYTQTPCLVRGRAGILRSRSALVLSALWLDCGRSTGGVAPYINPCR